jgi:hypothetical protein
MIIGRDARSRSVREGDLVIDERGRAWKVIATEASLRKRRIVRVRSVPLASTPKTYSDHTATARLFLTFKVSKPSRTETANKRRWQRLYTKYTRPILRREIKQRQRILSLPFQRCPVCIDTNQPCRFKLGIQVWKGKKLRVCSRACAAKVKKEVKKLIKMQPETDAERLRRHVAWTFTKKGENG